MIKPASGVNVGNSSKRIAFFATAKNIARLFPLTVQGVASLLLAAVALGIYGYGSMDLVVFALAICALAILIFCLFSCIISGMFVHRRIRRFIVENPPRNAIELEAEYPNETGFKIRAPTYLPLIKLSWTIEYPDYLQSRIRENSDGYLQEEVIPQRRCLSAGIKRRFEISDVLGFCKYSWLQNQDAPCMVLPRINTVKNLPFLRSLAAEDGIPNPSGNPEGDRMEIRPYVPGDSVRNIMWKNFARNRQLNVRLAEKSVFQSNRTVAYLLSSARDEAAAAVARAALESNALGDDWIFSADGSDCSYTDLPSSLRAIARSRALGEAYPYALDDFLGQNSAQGTSHCIVFAAAESAPWLLPLRNTIAAFSEQFTLILATDGIEEEEQPGFWGKLLLRDNTHGNLKPAGTNRKNLSSLLTELGSLVESTILIDRKTGASFDRHMRKI